MKKLTKAGYTVGIISRRNHKKDSFRTLHFLHIKLKWNGNNIFRQNHNVNYKWVRRKLRKRDSNGVVKSEIRGAKFWVKRLVLEESKTTVCSREVLGDGAKIEFIYLFILYFRQIPKSRKRKSSHKFYYIFKERNNFSVSNNIYFCTIQERNRSSVSVWSSKMAVTAGGRVSAANRVRTSRVKWRFISFSLGEIM